MKHAGELFRFERRVSRSPLIEQTWQTQSGSDEDFLSAAASHWDVFVDRLVRADLLVHDPVVAAAVAGLSTRSVERRVARATGLTRGTIRQIRRADRAVELRSRGMAPLDVARLAGYADQAHMTRSLRRFVGQTPSEIATPAAGS